MAASRAGGEEEGRVRVTLNQLSSRLDESRRELDRLLIDLTDGGPHMLSWYVIHTYINLSLSLSLCVCGGFLEYRSLNRLRRWTNRTVTSFPSLSLSLCVRACVDFMSISTSSNFETIDRQREREG
jgi:hypothetical protein